MPQQTSFVLFPGRHHLLTRFQADYLTGLVDRLGGDVTVVWAVTSANHETTKRNPIPYDRREAAIERFSVEAGLRSLVIAIHDTPPTDEFAEVTLKAVHAGTGDRLELTPADTVVACSTPEVSALYERLGFEIAWVEDDPEVVADGNLPARPWDVLLMLADRDPRWRELAHPATVDVYERYGLDEHVVTVLNDPVIGDDGGLTTTRDYKTYADSFEHAALRKWEQIAPFVRPGRILDVGCATGAVLELIDRDPRFAESDLIGVEVARHLFAECQHKVDQGVFHNPNVFFYQRNLLGSTVFSAGSIDTTLSLALTHEIWSYADGNRLDAVRTFLRRIADQAARGGVWINADVCGPDEPDREVRLTLTAADGANPPGVPELPADPTDRAAVAASVARLSTRARFRRFAEDFRANARVPFPYETLDDGSYTLRLGDAMDFLTRKDYTDNWSSESHEQFCGLTYADWVREVTAAGLRVDPASHAWRNDWIVENRIAPVASIADARTGAPLDWPVTHLLMVARRD